jgi:nucleoside-diphosphate kinase
MTKIEHTFLALKPGGIERGLLGEIIGRFERRGFRFIALKHTMVSRELTERHYEEHKGKDFFDDLVSYTTSGPVVLGVIKGVDAIAVARELVGATDPKLAKPGTIRSDYGIDMRRNLIHASDSEESAKREIALHFLDINLE